MTPISFVQTIYLGDRLCKSIVLDGINREVKIRVDLISRVRGAAWDFYSDEDIDDGYLVFLGVVRCSLDPSGLLPNDWIEIESVDIGDIPGTYAIQMSVGAAVAGDKLVKDLRVQIVATAMCLEDSKGCRIYL